MMHGHPEDGSGPDQPARVLRHHVLLADMDTVGADGQRHVDPVVDDQRHAALPASAAPTLAGGRRPVASGRPA